jgi:hypothetical protein
MTKSRLRLAILAAALGSAGAARADTVQANATTLLIGRQDFRDGALQRATPLYELLNVVASDVKTPFSDDLEVALSTWGSIDLGERRFWQNGALVNTDYTGDVNVGYVRAAFLDRHLSLRVGRQMVADGVARMVQLDGAEARLDLPAGFGLQGYVGAPVAPRFAGRGGELVVGNIRAVFATGGRLSWRFADLLTVGASVGIANDRDGEASRRDAGVDFRIVPFHFLVLTGQGFWSLSESRIGEAVIAATVEPVKHVEVTADFRHVEPDLFLPRTSILSVFAADKRNDIGGAVHWGILRDTSLDADYHYLIEDARDASRADNPSAADIPSDHGHWARAKGTTHPGGTDSTVGVELSLLKHPENGYKLARLFGGHDFHVLPVNITLDLLGYFFDRDVNGQPRSLTATGTVAYQFARAWKAALAGTAGTTPYLERQFEIMAKLVYEQTYAVREVR